MDLKHLNDELRGLMALTGVCVHNASLSLTHGDWDAFLAALKNIENLTHKTRKLYDECGPVSQYNAALERRRALEHELAEVSARLDAAHNDVLRIEEGFQRWQKDQVKRFKVG